jgi:hypothetical protein
MLTPNAQPFVLGDDTVQSLAGTAFLNGAGGMIQPGFSPEWTFATQRDELINSPYSMETPRLNAQVTYNWTVFRSIDTPDNALAFLADHPSLVPPVGTLEVIIGNTSRFLKNSVVKTIRGSNHENRGFTFSYSVCGSYVPPVLGAAGTGTGGPFITSQQL